MPDWVTSLPAVLTALLTLTHIVVCVLALGVFPGSRKPSTAMAWLTASQDLRRLYDGCDPIREPA